MIYHLDTIPVWEAMEKETPCPFCSLYERMEQQEVERSLGGSVMEPDTRFGSMKPVSAPGTISSFSECRTVWATRF